MRFKPISASIERSVCGNYEIRSAVTNNTEKGRSFFNGWHIPSGKHVSAGFRKDDVRTACDEHARKLDVPR